MEAERGYIEFFYQYDDRHPAVSIKLQPDADLTELFETFEGFLRAAGYHFTGTIDLVDNSSAPQEESAQN